MLPRKAAQRVHLSAKADSGRIVGSIGDLGSNSFQIGKTITAGEGDAVTTSDPVLYERAFRFHDVGIVSRSFNATVGQGVLGAFASCNLRMNEFTGAVMKGQVQKLDTICQALRDNAKTVREGIADLPGLKLRKSADVEGDLGTTVFLDCGTRERRDRFFRVMRAEGVSVAGAGGSVILRADARIASKATIHRQWPSFTTPHGKEIAYGPESCPRTIDIIGRFGGVSIGPRYTDEDVQDVIRAIRKVYRGIGLG